MLEKQLVIKQFDSGSREVEFMHTFVKYDRFGNSLGAENEFRCFRNMTNNSRRRINRLFWNPLYTVQPWVGQGMIDITIRRK